MKKIVFSVIVLGTSIAAVFPAYSRNTKYLLPITAALEVTDADEKPDGTVKFFFGAQPAPEIVTKLGSYAVSPKTSAIGKSDGKACNWAFLSTLVALQNHALELGANAVVNIVSYYKKNTMSSTTEFECHAGTVVAVVALKGDFVKIRDK